MRNPAFDNSSSGFNQNSYGDFDDSGHGKMGGPGLSVPTPGGNEQWFSSSPTGSPQANSGNMNYSDFANSTPMGYDDEDDYDNEPPLLEELGIRFDHIWDKTKVVINPAMNVNEHMLDDADIAGPLVYCLLLGSCLLLSGKVQFGIVYGFSLAGCLALYTTINLLHNGEGLDIWKTCSVLGYCLLPVVGLAAISIIISLKGFLGFILGVGVMVWCAHSATRLLDSKLHLTEQKWLVAYPVALFYSCFILITVF